MSQAASISYVGLAGVSLFNVYVGASDRRLRVKGTEIERI
jgi:hypothetical protein